MASSASQAVLIAVGIDWDGRRQILGVEMANRESQSSWQTFLLGLRERGLSGVELVVADDHAGLRAAIREVLRRRPIRGAMCTSAGMPSITCRARRMMTACRSYAGCTTAARSRRPGEIWPPGLPNGRGATRAWWPGPRRRSRRR